MLWWPYQVHPQSLRFTNKCAYPATPAPLRVDHSFQTLGALDFLHLNSVKLAAVNTVLAPIAQLRVDAGLISALGEDLVVRHLAYVGIMPDRAAASAAAAQRIWLGRFDLGMVHPLMHQSILFIFIQYGNSLINRYAPPMTSAEGVLR
jgi:hypothetical protein